jgi:hypothetical protein
MLFAMYIRRDMEIAGANTDEAVPAINIQTAHDRLTHPGKENVRKTAKELGWTLKRGNLKPCDACATGKAKQKNVPKVSKHQPAMNKNEARIFLDLATVKSPKDGPRMTKPNWRIMVDERTNTKFSGFFDTKNGMTEPTCERLQRWKDSGKEVRFIRLDNAGENILLQQGCESAD